MAGGASSLNYAGQRANQSVVVKSAAGVHPIAARDDADKPHNPGRETDPVPFRNFF